VSQSSRAVDQLKVPPHSIEAEQSVLGGLMLSTEAIDMVMDRVNENDFYRKDHRLIWRAIFELANRGMACDAVTLGDWFDANGLSEMVGGASYLVELANATPSVANIVAYADIVRDRSVMRQLIDASMSIATESFNPQGKTSDEVVELAEQKIFTIAENKARGRKGFTAMPKAMNTAFKVITDRYNSKGKLIGLSTGFTDLDRLTEGLQPSDLIIVAARPSMGKTSLATQFAEHAALKSKKAAVIFSMEMSDAQLSMRLIGSVGGIHQTRLRNGSLEEEDWPRLTNAIAQLNEAQIFIDDTAALSPGELRSRARRLHRELKRLPGGEGLGLIVIDYLQLMEVPGNKENRATEISAISRSLKKLAKELNVPVVALSQLNRSLEQRGDKRPLLSDLRESGAIEQDADVIMFIYRDEYYHKESPDKGIAEIIIGKQRMGPTDTVKLTFRGELSRFDNFSSASFVGNF
jgi:replicative DNA helicase